MDQRTFTHRLSASDSLMWRIELDPVLRSPILVVTLLDRSPTPDGLATTIERAATMLPRLRQRIEPPLLGLGRPRWRDEDQPSLANHIRRVRAPGDDIDPVLEIAEPDAAVADPELLDSCLEAALAEMVALGPQPQTLARGRTARRSA